MTEQELESATRRVFLKEPHKHLVLHKDRDGRFIFAVNGQDVATANDKATAIKRGLKATGMTQKVVAELENSSKKKNRSPKRTLARTTRAQALRRVGAEGIALQAGSTVAEMAKKAGVSRSTVYRRIKAGKITVSREKRGNRTLFVLSHATRFQKGRA